MQFRCGGSVFFLLLFLGRAAWQGVLGALDVGQLALLSTAPQHTRVTHRPYGGHRYRRKYQQALVTHEARRWATPYTASTGTGTGTDAGTAGYHWRGSSHGGGGGSGGGGGGVGGATASQPLVHSQRVETVRAEPVTCGRTARLG